MYGKKLNSQPIFVHLKEFQKTFKEAGGTSVLNLNIENNEQKAIIYDVAYDPLTDEPIHIDFLAVDMHKPIEAAVNIVFEGESEAVKLGGVLVKVVHELLLKALPDKMPRELKTDISKLKTAKDKLLVSDIALPKGASVIDKNPKDIVALIEEIKEETEEEKEIDFSKIESSKEKKEPDGEIEEKNDK